MKVKVQDIVYRANVREVRERVIRVADFALPSDKVAASLGTEAGQLLVSTSAGVWDVIDPPTADEQQLVSDLTLAKKAKWGAGGITNPTLTNKSGGDVSAGAVLVNYSSADSSFTTTTTEGAEVIGVAGEGIANDLSGTIRQVGLATVLVQGNVARGDKLTTSTTAGRAKTASANKGIFAIAMTAYAGGGAGSVTALILIEKVAALIGAASGIPTLDGSSKVVQNPADATATAAASKIPISDGSAKLDTWVSDASTTSKGKVELTIASEVDTGTSESLAVTPDALAGSNFGERVVQFAMNGPVALTTTDRAKFRVPSTFNGMDLVEVAANCGLDGSSGASSSGVVTITIQNGTTNMLSTNLAIDENEYDSATAATAAVINTSEDDVATGDIINVEISGAGTGVLYLVVTCVFRLP